jgi:bile acid:Na+ symporter, BASS family
MNSEDLIRILVITSLVGLLGAVGLRLTVAQVTGSLRKCPFASILFVNFVLVPALAAVAAVLLGISRDATIAMILLAAAPFAPVVPVFARMARADLALAAGLTSILPILSAFLTPAACELALQAISAAGTVQFDIVKVLLVSVATITLPLAGGVALHRWSPVLGERLLRPAEVISEATGAFSLAYVTATQFGSILEIGWLPIVGMGLVFECSVALGYWLGGRSAAARQVIALGTSNRNIALALLISVESFAGTPVVSAVVAFGLLMILLGLLHVAYWRWTRRSGVQPAGP